MGDYSPYKKLIDGTGFDSDTKDIPDNFLAGDAPKLKFNWTITFVDRETGIDGSSPPMNTNFFAAKTADRPKPTIEYMDINVYNFRTKVAVRTEYGTANAVFYDDSQNHAHTLLTKYLNHVSPVSTNSSGQSLDTGNNSSIGPLSNALGPWDSITLTHYYIKGNSTAMTTYKYLNPKIVNFDYGETDMTQSDVTTVSISFNYDTVFITEG